MDGVEEVDGRDGVEECEEVVEVAVVVGVVSPLLLRDHSSVVVCVCLFLSLTNAVRWTVNCRCRARWSIRSGMGASWWRAHSMVQNVASIMVSTTSTSSWVAQLSQSWGTSPLPYG